MAGITLTPADRAAAEARRQKLQESGTFRTPTQGPRMGSSRSGTVMPTGTGPVAGTGTGPIAPPPTIPGATIKTDVQANPYLAKTFDYFNELWGRSKDLYGKALDPTAAIKDYERMRTQGLSELQATGGGRGFRPGTGMSLAQMQGYGQGTEQGAQKLAADVQNAGLLFQKDLLGQMTGILSGQGGVGGDIARNQAALTALGLDAQRLGLDAWYKSNMLPIEMEKARAGTAAAQIAALGQLVAMV